MYRLQSFLIWIVLLTIVGTALIAAATSPLLAWRNPVYIAAGFAGVLALVLLLLQPLLAGAYLPGFSRSASKRFHRWVGACLFIFVIVHVAGLWVTSPPDVIDALTFTSAVQFSIWGVLAMWCVFATTALAIFRLKRGMKPKLWRTAHKSFALIIAGCTIAHAMMIDGTMEYWSKLVLCIAVVVATAAVIANFKLNK